MGKNKNMSAENKAYLKDRLKEAEEGLAMQYKQLQMMKLKAALIPLENEVSEYLSRQKIKSMNQSIEMIQKKLKEIKRGVSEPESKEQTV